MSIQKPKINSMLKIKTMGHWFSKIEAQDKTELKNIDYYKGYRSFKVSRKFYPQFYNGYLWGRYEDPKYWSDMGWEKIDGEWVRVAFYQSF